MSEPNPNITIIPLSFVNGFIQIERGDLLEMTVDIDQGANVAGPVQLSAAERDQLVEAVLKAPVLENSGEES